MLNYNFSISDIQAELKRKQLLILQKKYKKNITKRELDILRNKKEDTLILETIFSLGAVNIEPVTKRSYYFLYLLVPVFFVFSFIILLAFFSIKRDYYLRYNNKILG